MCHCQNIDKNLSSKTFFFFYKGDDTSSRDNNLNFRTTYSKKDNNHNFRTTYLKKKKKPETWKHNQQLPYPPKFQTKDSRNST